MASVHVALLIEQGLDILLDCGVRRLDGRVVSVADFSGLVHQVLLKVPRDVRGPQGFVHETATAANRLMAWPTVILKHKYEHRCSRWLFARVWINVSKDFW